MKNPCNLLIINKGNKFVTSDNNFLIFAETNSFQSMDKPMYTHAANSMREITDFVNENKLSKEQIVCILPAADGTFFISYYAS